MVKLLYSLSFLLVSTDFYMIILYRKLLLSYIDSSKRNKRIKVYSYQNKANKLTLMFIKNKYNLSKKQSLFHKIYLFEIFSVIPQYIVLLIINTKQSYNLSLVYVFVNIIVKIAFCMSARFQFDSNFDYKKDKTRDGRNHERRKS